MTRVRKQAPARGNPVTFYCWECGHTTPYQAAAERHADETGHCRIETGPDRPGAG